MLLNLFRTKDYKAEFDHIKKERDILHDALNQLKKEIQENTIKRESEVRNLIERAEAAKKKYESKPARLIPVEYYDFSDSDFMQGLSQMYNSKHFRYFVYNIQLDITSKISELKDGNPLELMGMLKCLSLINSMLADNEESLKQMRSPTPEEPQYD